jgi:Ser/Thr protein kinase RdoA (MazF antagonist)
MDPGISGLLSRKRIEDTAGLWAKPSRLEMIEDVENLVFDYESREGRRILRFTHSSHRTEDDVKAELDFVTYLADGGVRAARPVRSGNGRWTELVPVGDSFFTVCVFERAPGRWALEHEDLHRDERIVRDWGRTVGRMHALSKRYDASRLRKRRPAWDPGQLKALAREHVPKAEGWLFQRIERTLDRIRMLPRGPENHGLVHNDLNPGNFFVDDGRITVFDFDDCSYHWFVVDIASAVPLYSPMFGTSGWEAGLAEFLRPFLGGYLEENRLEALWFERLGEFLRLSVMDSAVFSFMLDERNRRTWDAWFTKVLDFARNGHPLFEYDFQGFYDSVCKNGETR